MINSSMKLYDFYLYGDNNGYGTPTLSDEVQGQIKMAISITSQSVQDNINYKGAQCVGFTHDANVNDKYVIVFNNTKLKVLYVNPQGRYKQVFLGAM